MIQAQIFSAPRPDFADRLNDKLRAIQEDGGRVVGVQCIAGEVGFVAVVTFDADPEQQNRPAVLGEPTSR